MNQSAHCVGGDQSKNPENDKDNGKGFKHDFDRNGDYGKATKLPCVAGDFWAHLRALK